MHQLFGCYEAIADGIEIHIHNTGGYLGLTLKDCMQITKMSLILNFLGGMTPDPPGVSMLCMHMNYTMRVHSLTL